MSIPGQMRDQRQRRSAITMDFKTKCKNGEYGDIAEWEASEQYLADQMGDNYDRENQLQLVG